MYHKPNTSCQSLAGQMDFGVSTQELKNMETVKILMSYKN